MTPSARAQAAIEVLDAVLAAAREGGAAADVVIERYFQARRYAGSGDRRAVRELAFAAIRAFGEPPPSGRAALIGYAAAHQPELFGLFGSGPHAPAPLASGEREAAPLPHPLPRWLEPLFAEAFGAQAAPEADALLARAPLDLRANRLQGGRAAALAALPEAEPTPRAPDGLRLAAGTAIERHPAYLAGLVEVQDEGSQLAALGAGAEPGMTVVDLCAGAGGKTLALAAAMANAGRIVACDTDRRRLGQLGPRAARAGVTISEPRLLDPPREAAQLADLRGSADLVLIDAPCSGSGTWRRNPEARWRLTAPRLEQLAAVQARLLDLGSALVAPGGRLVYIVCSVLPSEGAQQADAFPARAPGFAPAPLGAPLAPSHAALLTPARAGTDGFFIAAFAPIC
ncbi:MAG: RsmB/NOP family class I SAM-dependent RNA methyltransferase [Sphingomonadaceae bacterium]|nr:RsmB/NOP family class I SAM-dependent RNA methyltransferase [Sphingomonadaceae bacterium]